MKDLSSTVRLQDNDGDENKIAEKNKFVIAILCCSMSASIGQWKLRVRAFRVIQSDSLWFRRNDSKTFRKMKLCAGFVCYYFRFNFNNSYTISGALAAATFVCDTPCTSVDVADVFASNGSSHTFYKDFIMYFYFICLNKQRLFWYDLKIIYFFFCSLFYCTPWVREAERCNTRNYFLLYCDVYCAREWFECDLRRDEDKNAPRSRNRKLKILNRTSRRER